MTAAQAFPATSWKARQAGALSLIRHGSWGMADQALISATHFVTMVLLARGLGPAAFGAFSLVYGGILFANSLHGALILQPHSVLSASRKGREYANYTASTGVAQLLFSTCAALLATAAGIVTVLGDWPVAHMLFALAPCVVAWQSQEFVRRVLYNEGRFGAAFGNDVISYGGQTAVIATLWAVHVLTPPLALYAIAASSAAAVAVGLWQIRRSLAGRLSPSVLGENWRFGKWLAGAEMGYWASSQLYLYLTGMLLGAAAAGVMRAGYVIFGPTRILGFFLRTVLPNRFARTLAGGGKAAMHEQVKLVWSVIAPLMASYCLLVAVFADPLVRLLYGEQFAGQSTVVVLYAVFAFIALMTSVLTSALRATQLGRHLFVSQLYATVLAVPVGWVLITYWGVEGAVAGMILTNLVVGFSNYLAYRREQFADVRPRAIPAEIVATEAEADDRSASAAAVTLRRVLDVLDENGIGYCVLHGYEQFARHVSSDVDCLVSADALPRRLAQVLRASEERLGAKVVQWFQDAAHFIVLAGRNAAGQRCFLQLHASADYELAHRTLYCGEEVLEGGGRNGVCCVPAPAIEFGSYLARRIAKGEIRDDHARRLETLYHRDPLGCRDQSVRLWGSENADLVVAAAALADWGAVRRCISSLRAQQNFRALRLRPLRVARNCLAGAVRRLRRWWRADRGLDVVLLGPDGAGKSSVIDAVRNDLTAAFVGSQRRTFPPGLLRSGRGTDCLPHARPQRSFLSSSARALCYWFVYCTLGHFLFNRRALASGTLVLHDRHLLDALVDPRRYRYGGAAWLLKLICRLVPRPDLVILLDAPADVIRARKQEVSAEETRRQCAAYRLLVAGLPNAHVVDAAMPIPQVVTAVEDVILGSLARRSARQLGLEVRQ
jgi:O-antigen/teichoic acid export membrane protein/thymidylate kinase